MAKLQSVRGTHDMLPDDSPRFRHVTETARSWAARYGYGEIATPIFEFTEVFQRTLGETSDVVTKEMYTFEDRGGEQITLRPEHTAGIVRAMVSNGLASQLPLKVFASGPTFRYERPQKGRLRQFHQIDVELLGVPGAQADVEVITLAADILGALGVAAKTTLELNTLGDGPSRDAYRERLVAYFSDHRDDLSEDSQARLNRNPLRILDSKAEGDRALVVDAPKMSESLNAESSEFFDAVCDGLDAVGIAYTVNDRLVRGLDYYAHTAFEFTTTELGSQGAVIAGGRYDGLTEMMGGPPTAGIGWAGGIERLAMLVDHVPAAVRPISLIPMGDAGEAKARAIAHELRGAGFTIDLGFSGNLKKRLKRANKLNAVAAVLLGEDELARGEATVRDLESGEQTAIDLDGLTQALNRYRNDT
ncbi:MAG: histidine--tRNA ligase [Alphaproteobacteria bacterium]|jgi:histidyl-tRNA synthetase|nr:histidine--tRNA ligase [Alphaproteobacteria bacterium]